MSQFIKVCIRCKKKFEYNQSDELTQWFYFTRKTYPHSICKDCERQEHREKYASGQYNWRRNHKDEAKKMAIGNLQRCQ